MLKKIFLFMLAFIPLLTACDIADFAVIIYDISNAEEFFAIEENKRYRLVNDIDLKGLSWTPIKISDLYGNGYSISNFKINEIVKPTSSIDGVNYGLFTDANSIQDLEVFDFNIYVQTNETSLTFGTLAGYVDFATNINIHDGTVNVISTYTSNLTASTDVGGAFGKVSRGLSYINVSNLNINLNCSGDGNLGGVVASNGYGLQYIDTLISENNILSCLANDARSAGIGSLSANERVKLISRNNKITATSKTINQSLAFGISHSLKNGQAIVSRNNEIKADSAYGLALNISDSQDLLSIDNTITATRDKDNIASGACNEISSSKNVMSIGNVFIDCYSYGLAKTISSFVSGLVVNDIDATEDIFASLTSELYLENCYCGTDTSGPNSNNVPSLNTSIFMTILDLLNLNQDIWEFDSDNNSFKLTIE